MRHETSLLIVLAVLLAAVVPAPAAGLVAARTVPFALDKATRLDLTVGDLRVTTIQVVRDRKPLIRELLPPPGGESRFSWVRYTVFAENPGDQAWTLNVQVTLLDENDAVIDEFVFRKRIWRGRAGQAQIRRITLNYAIPLVKKMKVTVSAQH